MTSFLPLLALLAFPPSTLEQGAPSLSNAKIFEAIGVREGMTVCEMGAGDGELTIEVARLVGSAGRVFTSELGDERVKALRDRVAKSGVTHISVTAGDASKTNFPDAACDALFMRNVYHHFAEPAAMNTSIAAALKPGARFGVVDFTPPPGAEARDPKDRGKDGSHGICPESLARELTEAGFEAVSSDTTAPRWFMVVVRRPKT